MIQKITAFLDFYHYPYKIEGQQIDVEINEDQMVSLILSSNGIEKIEDRMLNWNFLSGMLEHSIFKVFKWNSIGLVAIWALLELIQIFDLPSINPFYMLILVMAYFLLWSGYYLIKLESFKIKLNAWVAQ